MDLGTVLASAAVSGGINFIVWLAFRRSIERTDAELIDTRKELNDMKHESLANIQRSLSKCVTEQQCAKNHAELTAALTRGSDRIYATALKLEAVAAQVDRAVEWVRDVSSQVIAAKEDVANIVGRLEESKRG